VLAKVDGFGEYAWTRANAVPRSVDAIVKKSGNNALPARRYSPSWLRRPTSTRTDVARQRRPAHPTPCFLVHAGQETRGSPGFTRQRPGTFDCNKSNGISVQAKPDHRAVRLTRPAVRPALPPQMGSGRHRSVAVEGAQDHGRRPSRPAVPAPDPMRRRSLPSPSPALHHLAAVRMSFW